MQKAMHLVAMATEVHGKERYDLLTNAAKTNAACRDCIAKCVPLSDPTLWQARRSEHLVRVAIAKLGGWVGSMVTGVSYANKRSYASVKRIVNKADPVGLLAVGAPDDEYHPEIEEIAFLLPRWRTLAQTHTGVHRVFVKWFGSPGMAGPRSAYKTMAATLYALRPAARFRSRAARLRAR